MRSFLLWRKDLVCQLYRIGVETLWIVIILNFALSFALIYQVNTTLGIEKYGLLHLLGALSIGVTREMVPLIVGLIVAARLGSAFAAEIASMKISEQIDALKSMAVDPLEYLVLPRFFAAALMMISLTVFGWLSSFAGGFLIAKIINVDIFRFMDSAKTFFQYSFMVVGLLKAVVFGAVIALISCFSGFMLNERDLNNLGVGRATMRAVVLSFLAIFLINLFFAWVVKY